MGVPGVTPKNSEKSTCDLMYSGGILHKFTPLNFTTTRKVKEVSLNFGEVLHQLYLVVAPDKTDRQTDLHCQCVVVYRSEINSNLMLILLLATCRFILRLCLKVGSVYIPRRKVKLQVPYP